MRRWRGLGFAGFCLLAGSRWLLENAYPSALPPLLRQGFHFAVLGLGSLIVWLAGRRPLPVGWWRVCLAGFLLFGVPAVVSAWAGSQAGPGLFTLMPLCVIVCVTAISPERGVQSLMMPALAGAAGGLLVLPFTLPATFSGAAILAAGLVAVASAAAGSVWLHRLSRRIGLLSAVWPVCGANAVMLVVAGLTFESGRDLRGGWLSELARASIVDAPEVFLLLWLLREIRPERVAARALLVPLVTVVEGLVLLRPGLDLRLVFGVLLMLGAASALVLWKDDGEEVLPAPLGLGR